VSFEVKEEDRQAALGDLRELIRIAQERGEVEVIEGADPHLEMGALYELSIRHRYPPLLLFENIPGYPVDHRILMNVRFSRLFSSDLSLDALRKFRKRRKGEADPIPPEEVNWGPVMENVIRGDDVDVRAFPAGHWHEHDGGPYIGTECLIINKDPDSEWVNVGTYRVQVQDEKTLTVFIEPGKHARPYHSGEVVGAGQGMSNGSLRRSSSDPGHGGLHGVKVWSIGIGFRGRATRPCC
jgi:UbiD family decarboxylase